MKVNQVAPVKLHWTLWLWTNSEESLFDLSPENLYVFKLLVQEARK